MSHYWHAPRAVVACARGVERTAAHPRTAHAGLAVRDVVVSFGGITALDGVSVDVSPGEVLGVIGPNGAGKTTLFNVICGFVRPNAGRSAGAVEPMARAAPDRLASLGIARTLQGVGLFAWADRARERDGRRAAVSQGARGQRRCSACRGPIATSAGSASRALAALARLGCDGRRRPPTRDAAVRRAEASRAGAGAGGRARAAAPGRARRRARRARAVGPRGADRVARRARSR